MPPTCMSLRSPLRWGCRGRFWSSLSLMLVSLWAPCLITAQTPGALVIQLDGKVEVARENPNVWDLAYTNQALRGGDQLRTGEGSRAVLRLSDQTTMRVGELSRVQIPTAN